MKVITNSGPLIALGKLGLLDLPGQLYGQPLFLPSAVHAEVVLRGSENDHADAHATQLAINRSYLRVISVGPRDLPPDLAEGRQSHRGRLGMMIMACLSSGNIRMLLT